MEKDQMYDKYTYKVEWNAEENTHIARCLEFPSLLTHGNTALDALRELEYVVRETIIWMIEEGEEVPEPFGLKSYKGKLSLRVPPELHRKVAMKSAEEGISINSYIISRIATTV